MVSNLLVGRAHAIPCGQFNGKQAECVVKISTVGPLEAKRQGQATYPSLR